MLSAIIIVLDAISTPGTLFIGIFRLLKLLEIICSASVMLVLPYANIVVLKSSEKSERYGPESCPICTKEGICSK